MNEHTIEVDMTESAPENVYSWIYLLLLYSGLYLVCTGVSRIVLRQSRIDSTTANDAGDDDGVRQEDKGTFESLKDQCVVKQADTRVVPCQRAMSYGLDADEQSASVLYGELDTVEDLTTRELCKLQKMPSFKQWCVKNKIHSDALQDIFSRLHIYKKLKEIHPASFWALCSESSLVSVDVVEPGVLVSLTEYVVSRVIDCTVAYSLYWHATSPSGISKIVLAVQLYSLVIRRWLRGRSSGAGMFSAWYETSHLSEQYRTTSGMIRTSLASILEDIFVLGTLGLGALISMYTRCFSESKQSIGERIAGVTLIVETTRRLDDD